MKSTGPHEHIVISLPVLQDLVTLVDSFSRKAIESEEGRWADLARLLSDLYIQLQHQKEVTVHRSGHKGSGSTGNTRHARRA